MEAYVVKADFDNRLQAVLSAVRELQDAIEGKAEIATVANFIPEANTTPSARKVMKLIEKKYGNVVYARSNSPSCVMPRKMAAYLMRRVCGLSYPQIGRILRKHHTTVLFHVQDIDSLIPVNKMIANEVEALKKELTA